MRETHGLTVEAESRARREPLADDRVRVTGQRLVFSAGYSPGFDSPAAASFLSRGVRST